MKANEFKDKFLSCMNELGNERIRIVSDDYYLTVHDVVDVRVNLNNWTIEIVTA